MWTFKCGSFWGDHTLNNGYNNYREDQVIKRLEYKPIYKFEYKRPNICAVFHTTVDYTFPQGLTICKTIKTTSIHLNITKYVRGP